MSEDANFEYPLGILTSTNTNPESIWIACTEFMEQLYWHKPQLVVLGPKIEALPDTIPPRDCVYGIYPGYLMWLGFGWNKNGSLLVP